MAHDGPVAAVVVGVESERLPDVPQRRQTRRLLRRPPGRRQRGKQKADEDRDDADDDQEFDQGEAVTAAGAEPSCRRFRDACFATMMGTNVAESDREITASAACGRRGTVVRSWSSVAAWPSQYSALNATFAFSTRLGVAVVSTVPRMPCRKRSAWLSLLAWWPIGNPTDWICRSLLAVSRTGSTSSSIGTGVRDDDPIRPVAAPVADLVIPALPIGVGPDQRPVLAVIEGQCNAMWVIPAGGKVRLFSGIICMP